MKPFITQAVDDMVRGPLASRLKAVGFRRDGSRFTRPVDDLSNLVEAERWKWNEHSFGGVRVVFGVFCPQVWQLRLEVWPELSSGNSSAKPRLDMCPLIEYMNTAVPLGEALYGYWPVREGDDVQAVGASFSGVAIEQMAPWFATHSNRPAMIEALTPRSLAGDLPSAVSMLLAACIEGQTLPGKFALEQVLVRKPGTASFNADTRGRLEAIAKRHGIT